MQKKFATIRDYHRKASDVCVDAVDWCHVRASVLKEPDGDVVFERTDRSGICVTLDGTGAHLTRMDGINDETPSRAGEVCLIPAGLDVHLAWVNHDPVQTSVMLEFDDGLFVAYAPEVLSEGFTEGHLLPSNFSDRAAISALAKLIAREIDPDQQRGRLFAESAFRLLAIEVARSSWSRPAKLTEARPRTDRRVQRAIDFIEANFHLDISLLEIGAAAGLSATHLTGIFRREMGVTPYSFVIGRRLRHAVHLLRSTDAPIAQIALEAGFSDQQHMTRIFRDRLDTTPGALRRG